MLEERAAYWEWATLSAQNDPQVQKLLYENIGTYADLIPPRKPAKPYKPHREWKPPESMDWLTGEIRPGIWFRSLTARRWEIPPLGVDSRKMVSIMRPMYQYVVTHVDKEGNLLLSSEVPTSGNANPALIFNPYSPHTISPNGRPCNQCHGNTKAVGLGRGMMGMAKPRPALLWRPEPKLGSKKVRWDALIDKSYNPIQFSAHPEAGPLNKGAVSRLMRPSMRHKALWSQRAPEMDIDLDTTSGRE
jgi:hypothetical protein